MQKVIIDTNIFGSALLNKNGAPRNIIRHALNNDIQPVFGNALFSEYEDVLSRDKLFTKSVLSKQERTSLFMALLSVSDWVPIYFLWRPNLRDESDNHLIELAIASGTKTIITANKKDMQHGDLMFPDLNIQTAGEFLKRRKLS